MAFCHFATIIFISDNETKVWHYVISVTTLDMAMCHNKRVRGKPLAPAV
jgi:hypothetical protein